MADFCKDCSIEHFGEDYGDLAGLVSETQAAQGTYARAICEGCGFVIYVDHEGRRVDETLVADSQSFGLAAFVKGDNLDPK